MNGALGSLSRGKGVGGGGGSQPLAGVGAGWALRSLPTQAILWLSGALMKSQLNKKVLVQSFNKVKTGNLDFMFNVGLFRTKNIKFSVKFKDWSTDECLCLP